VVDHWIRQPRSARIPPELVNLASPTAEGLDNIIDIITEIVCINDILKTLERDIETRPSCILR